MVSNSESIVCGIEIGFFFGDYDNRTAPSFQGRLGLGFPTLLPGGNVPWIRNPLIYSMS